MTTTNDDHHDPKKNRIKNKIQPKQASNVEAAATKLSQEKNDAPSIYQHGSWWCPNLLTSAVKKKWDVKGAYDT